MTSLREEDRLSGRKVWALGLAIAAAVLAAYANALHGPFVYDDTAAIASNPSIRHLWPLGPVLSPPGGGLTVGGRPLLNLSFALDFALGGLRVPFYHATNILIHLLAALTLFGLARRTLERLPAAKGRAGALAFAIALLWAVHPLLTEAVTYTVQRAESLMGLFYLLTLYCFVRQAASPGRGWGAASVGACLLGMATKEPMVSAPVIVLLYDRTFLAGSFRQALRRRRMLYAGLAATWCLLAWLVFSQGATRGGSTGFDVGLPWWAYGVTQFRAVVDYLRLALWPSPLVFDYGRFVEAQVWPAAGFGVLVALLLVLTAIALVRRPALGFLGAWFFALLAPSSVIPVAMQMMAEHRMYLALAPVVAAAVWGGFLLLGSRPRIAWALAGVAAVSLGIATARRNATYATAVSLWRDAAARRPDNPVAHSNLGAALSQLPGRQVEAIHEFEEAVRLRPHYAEAQYNLANELRTVPRRAPEAAEHYQAAIRANPEYVQARVNLANVLAGLPGRRPEAIEQYYAALRLAPNDPQVRFNLALELARDADGLARRGMLTEAVAQYEQALRLDPQSLPAHHNLGVTYAKLGNYAAARTHLEAAVKLNAADSQARALLDRLSAIGR